MVDTIIERATLYEDGRMEFHGPPARVSHIVGLDLGQARDYTAVAGIEKHGDDPDKAVYYCKHLQRFKLGTSYPHIVDSVRELCRREPLRSNRPRLAIDQTGVGRPVVDLFKQATINADIKPILIHGGDHAVYENGAYRVPKRELVAATQVLLQTGRFKIAGELPDVGVLTQELQNFQVKISDSGFDTYEGLTGVHDDLVLSVAMALWLGQRGRVARMY